MLFYNLRSDRKVIEIVPERKLSWSEFLRKATSAANSGAVSQTKVTELMRWYRVGSSNCCSHNLPQSPTCRLPLLCRYVVGFPRSTCGFVETFHGFKRKEICIFTISLQNLRNYEMPFGSDAWRMVFLTLTEVPCQTSCPYFCPCKTAHANHHLHRCFLHDFVCSAGNSCRTI